MMMMNIFMYKILVIPTSKNNVITRSVAIALTEDILILMKISRGGFFYFHFKEIWF